jgi:hypothetical protein
MAYKYVASDLFQGDVQHHPFFFHGQRTLPVYYFSPDHFETDNMSLNEK